jgi:hypothetical protein
MVIHVAEVEKAATRGARSSARERHHGVDARDVGRAMVVAHHRAQGRGLGMMPRQ